MKKSIFAALLSFCISSAAFGTIITSESDSVLAGATLVDFESATAASASSQAFGDLTITAPGATFSVASDYAGEYNTRGLLHVSNLGYEFQLLRFDVTGGFSALAFLFGASDSSWTLSVFDSSNTLLDALNIAAVYGSNAGDYFGLTGFGNASYATLTQNADGAYAGGGVDYVFVDNIRFVSGSTSVPEPSAILLLMSGLLLAGIRLHKSK